MLNSCDDIIDTCIVNWTGNQMNTDFLVTQLIEKKQFHEHFSLLNVDESTKSSH